MDMARKRFPNDPMVVRARAEADLEMRAFWGQRQHDA
jgi:hypothetical protein